MIICIVANLAGHLHSLSLSGRPASTSNVGLAVKDRAKETEHRQKYRFNRSAPFLRKAPVEGDVIPIRIRAFALPFPMPATKSYVIDGAGGGGKRKYTPPVDTRQPSQELVSSRRRVRRKATDTFHTPPP